MAAEFLVPKLFSAERPHRRDFNNSMERVNSTHVELPTSTAVRIPKYANFQTAYAHRKPERPDFQGAFAIWEHRYSLTISTKSTIPL
eukprot:554405-Amphidinium_carterae.1